jgi:chromosome partitioning protein
MIINIINNKGGTGKTTTCVNLAAALAYTGYSVLLIDLDSQASASASLGFEGENSVPTIADILFNDIEIENAIIDTSVENLSFIPGDIEMANSDLILADVGGREKLLKKSLSSIEKEFDFILFDSPPSLSVIFINSLTASDFYIVPIVPEYLAFKGFMNLMTVMEKIKEGMNISTKMLGILFTMVNPSIKRNRKITKEIIHHLKKEYGDYVLKTMIVRSAKLNEAPANSSSIFEYAPHSTGARQYMKFTEEVIERCREYVQ